MRKLLVSIFAVSVLGLGGAFAQVVTVDTEADTPYWAGISSGFPFGANLHFGLSDALGEDMDVRVNTSLGVGFFGVGADLLFGLPIETGTTPVDVYLGGGPNVAVGFGGGAAVGVNLFGGAEYRLTDAGFAAGGIFAEVGPSLVFVPVFVPIANVKLGFNYHF
jgi:hypothetical protein